MKRKLLILAFTVAFVLALGACASAPRDDGGMFGTAASAPAPTAMPNMPMADFQMRGSADASWFMTGAAVFEEAENIFMDHAGEPVERRISTTADIDMETYELEDSISAVRELVWLNGGFIEQAEFSMHGWHWRHSSFSSNYNATLRIPGENYEAFLDGLREIGEIIFLSESTQDHTAAYFDASIRLETRQIEETRIIELIERARYSGEISDLLQLEGLLRNVRLEIEGLTRQIDHIDRLVSFHTIHLNLFEIEEQSAIVPITLQYRAGTAFTQSINDIVSFSQNFTIFFASIIAPAALLAAIFLLIRATRRKLKKS